MSNAADRPFCAEVSQDNDEPLGATASRVDYWFLVEYRGLWARDALPGSGLSDGVKQHLRAQTRALPHSRLLFVRRPERRGRPGLRVYFAASVPGEEALVRHELDDHEQLRELELWRHAVGEEVGRGLALDHPLFLVCTHGKHDRCCARRGRPLYDALAAELDGDWVWQSSHIGGDRFAGNLVCLPHGVYYGRVERADIAPILDQHLAGRVHLPRLRGRSCWPMAVQAAENAVREHTGNTEIFVDHLERWERTGPASWRIRLGGLDVDVAVEEGDFGYLTCGTQTVRRPRHYVATRVSRAADP